MVNSNSISGKLNSPGELAVTPLPVRAEKRFVPIPTGVAGASAAAFNISAALAPFTKYMTIRIPGRGRDSTGNYSPSIPAVYSFLINPHQVGITKTTIDSQSFSRGGWQFGLWGEAPTAITLSGKTPGRYFQNGLTDQLAPYTMSFRNLEALEVVVENNGYWFEGEQTDEGPLAAASTRRLIKLHQDVELMVGEFIWQGMLESMEVEESADTPFLASYTVNFTAWKERYAQSTPYLDAIHNNVQRGHVPKTTTEKVTSTIKYSDGPQGTLTTNIQNPGNGTFSV